MPRIPVTLSLALLAACLLLLTQTVSTARSTDGTDSPPALVEGAVTDVAVLVNTTQTSEFNPPSPDPTGIVYLPAAHSLLIADSEVNEMELFTGSNLFYVSLSGNLLGTLTTTSFSDEPTGVAHNPDNNHLFFSDDTGTRGYYEQDPGPDGKHGTADDVVTFVGVSLLDPEDIAFDSNQGHLFIADGANGGSESIYEVDPGPNGIFDGAPPAGDDIVTSFDALALGIRDPEGVAYNPDNDHLYIVSGTDALIAETSRDGTLVRYIDVSVLNAHSLAGLAYAPGSNDLGSRHLYIVDRGVDNDLDPDENDGVLFEVAFPLNIDNLPPYVDAGPDQVVKFEDGTSLAGEVADDGNPDPPAALTITWSQVAGPGTANFADSADPMTTVSFTTPGIYVLRLTADDGALSTADDVTIAVNSQGLLHFPAYFFMMPGANSVDPRD